MHPNISLPEAFLAQIQATMPSHLSMEEFVAACQRPLRRSIRVNTLKISVDAFKQRAAEHHWTLTPVPWCDTGFWIERQDDDKVPLGNTAEHMAGLFYIQEASSMMPVTALLAGEHEPGQASNWQHVLDVAAAPGSKTTQLAASMQNSGILVANEFSASRIKGLHANVQRCGVRNVALTHFDGRVFGGWLPEQFDAILLDAPCSGEGTIRKDPDAMNNWSLASVDDIAQTQQALIDSAFHALRPGGVLVYSTCTLNHTENQSVCHWLKQTYGDAVTFESLKDLFPGAEQALTDEGFLHLYPQIFDSEGFFVARIRKHASATPPSVKKRLGKFPFSPASQKDSQQISATFKKELGLSLPDAATLWLRDKEVWLFPSAIEPMLGEVKFDRIGIKLAETHRKGYRWQHEAIIALSTQSLAECKTIALTKTQAVEWYQGRDIWPEQTPEKGDVIVTYQGDVLGLGKWVGNRIKNGLPRDQVRDSNLF
ncbi:16S rRNA (cytosine(1407)-C(5))-methyltransferase RsmF [Salinivibrio costicola]|uniref:Ribosomal RNA small subunit methyltransferase F n=1 Tax=Salinivibrio costicola TaxID=51367 RepID=A0ABX6K7B1_SALCS|nr:16S rRNA (cytosine(1407)-C(5))-methyltransferase RsmF [Salinivibrio costicola]QIR06151.1 16S rRNA (cytosine(1407)-C(5))-methyltransferase RsmF [Salinivibrio costicola]